MERGKKEIKGKSLSGVPWFSENYVFIYWISPFDFLIIFFTNSLIKKCNLIFICMFYKFNYYFFKANGNTIYILKNYFI